MSRGAAVDDSELILQLFRAYGVVADAKFNTYIEQVRNSYEDQERNVSPDKLMQLALNKYRTLKLRGDWTQPTSEAKQLQALTAQIQALKDKALKLGAKKGAGKGKKPFNNDNKGGKGKKGKQGKKDKGENDKWAWLSIPPKDGEPQVKTVDDVEWYFCTFHNKWQKHTTEECKAKANQAKGKAQGNKKTYVARAATIEEEDDQESSSDEDSI